mgnify:FL=1
MTEQLKKPKSDYAGHRKRLREKFFQAGSDGLHDYEAIELLLTLVLPRIDTKPIAQELPEVEVEAARPLNGSEKFFEKKEVG